MNNSSRDIEILAPAGSPEQLQAAVNNGCDSVYLGLESFNARMKAPNFTRENLSHWVDHCHLRGVKVYVTINTSLKNEEFGSAVELLKAVYLANADGVIVTDPALMRLAAQLPKPFDVTASTQLNIHDKSGARFAAECGATTVVCARECSLKQIQDISSTGIRTECFIHGATCVCQSGQCLFSAMVGGNSGNRGLCAQPCRKLYSANGQEWAYLLSARDLLGVGIAKKLYDAGVSVFKIEGRNRRAEYAGVTSEVYRKLFENGFAVDEKDIARLAEVYNRDMSELSYLHGGNENIVSPSCQAHRGVVVGSIKNNKIDAFVEIKRGDGFKILYDNREVCGAIACANGRGLISAQFDGEVRDGMQVCRTTSTELCNQILAARRSRNVKLKFTAKQGERARLEAACDDVEVQITSDFVVPQAQNAPISKEEIIQLLKKTGNSHYTICDIAVDIDKIFLAKSQVNALRREILTKLDEAILQSYNIRLAQRKEAAAELEVPQIQPREKSPMVAVVCRTADELSSSADAELLIYKPELLNIDAFELAKKFNAFVDIPSFASDDELASTIQAVRCGIVCHNVGTVQLARAIGIPYIAGSGLNIYNDYIAEVFSDAVTFVYSQELTLAEIGRLRNKGGLIFVDGEITLMKPVHCPYKLIYDRACSECKAEKLCYRDELGNEFYLQRRKGSRCFFELINGKKLSVVSKLKRPDRFLVDYDPDVVRYYKNINNGLDDGYVEGQPYTKGRLFDKVK